MTNHWVDFKNSDLFLVIGANPAENHPCGWKWAFHARDHRGARIIHVDPRFTRTSATADKWVAIRAGTDVAFFGGMIRHILENQLYHDEYVKLHTNASFVVSEGFSFQDGLFSGYDEAAREYDTSTWEYERMAAPAPGEGEDAAPSEGFAVRDLSLQHPRSVFQLLKQHYARYTPEVVEEVTGIPADEFVAIADEFGSTGVPEKVGNIVYAVGLTHHTQGSQMIRAAAIVQLLLGNMGRPGGGMNAERGHANIQGNTDNAQSWEILPGYLQIPRPGMETLDQYETPASLTQMDAGSINFFGSNYRKFMISLLKAWYGESAQAANEFHYSYIPKPDKNWSWMTFYAEALAGRLHGLFNSGMSSVNIGPDSNRVVQALSRLKWLVVMDPFPTASSEFWHGEGVDPASVDTEVFFLPTTHWIEKAGAFVNSGRWTQWKHAALPAEGDVKDDAYILSQLLLRLQALYQKEGGAFPDPILDLHWPYSNPNNPPLEEVSREINGRDLTTGAQLATFNDAKDDGTTAIGNWIYTGSWTEEGNMMDRRGTDDPTGLGFFHNWAWSWPANRRVLYNRASADADGRPWDATRPGIVWNGQTWKGDVPDFTPDSPPSEGKGAFIMTGEGVARIFAPGSLMMDGPIPEHYEPVESPVENVLSPTRRVPTTILYEGVAASFAEDDSEFPYVATTYRVTEHEHFVTQYVPYLVEAMPDFFIELPRELANEKGISDLDQVRVSSKRGHVQGVALVTKRMRPLRLGNKVVYQVGIPVHWHPTGGHGKGNTAQMVNLLTPYVGDGTTVTPEFKAFLVNVERA